jgi:hypothetical protein
MSDVIDWSKAPEGWDVFIKSGFFSGFYRDAGDRYERENGYYRLKEDEADYTVFRRPWSGKGLPPVGVVCEVDGENVVVVAHHCNGVHAIYAESLTDGLLCYGDPGEFRPARTTEQIAADERNHAIANIVAQSLGRCDSIGAAYIYDAGYRKP